MTALLTELTAEKEVASLPEKSNEEKLKAAYALNLCTVSVSQIIDYNDIRFLESEYDAILNNLNLEQMPKDEALLHILKQLLDVITFFKISEGEKQMMEKEYAQKVKDAIWSAIPSPAMLITSGSPISIALSLASQIGTGYMNYRKEKAKIKQEKERKEWEMQRSAIEQFNGLRRELFDTAWRLADEYAFPDAYRITERQISQFNAILLDTDSLRKYERLAYIQESFEAYPPFWYYLGNAANSVYQNERYSDSVRATYKKNALKHFDRFLEGVKQNLLREDQLIASCALEKFDLIEDKAEKMRLLSMAAHSSGNAFDVLQLCAISYLKIGETCEACKLLRMLINENYNETMNAQLLSRLYVSEIIKGDHGARDDYETLGSRVLDPRYLFPLPQTGADEAEASKVFLDMQKRNLAENYAVGLARYVEKCEQKYIEICNFSGNIAEEIAAFMRDMGQAAALMLDDSNHSADFMEKIREKSSKLPDFSNMIRFDVERVNGTYRVDFAVIFGEAFMSVAGAIKNRVSELTDMSAVSVMESHLYDFLRKNGLPQDIYNDAEVEAVIVVDSVEDIFGKDFKSDLANTKLVNAFLTELRQKGYGEKTPLTDDEKTDWLLRGDPQFKSYLERNGDILCKAMLKEESIIAVLNDRHSGDTDLIFTTDEVVVTGWFNIKGRAPYAKITMDKSGRELDIGACRYGNKKVRIKALLEMISHLTKLAAKNRELVKRFSDDIKHIILD